MKIKYLAICLFLLCCLIGAVSAADDVSTDILDDSVDNVANADMKIEDTGDSMTVEESPILAETPGYDDKAIETNEESAQTIKNEESSIENPPASMFDASILGDRDKDEIYANSSDSLSTALINIRDGGVIYLEDSKYSRAFDSNVNCTIIGINKENAVFEGNYLRFWEGCAFQCNDYPITTFVNITFKYHYLDFIGCKTFINCTFINGSFSIGECIHHDYMGTPENYAFDDSFTTTFIGCEFFNSSSEGNFLESYKFARVDFKNCTFENISANSLVNNNGGFTLNDAINFYECSFNNVNVKGILDVPTRTNPFERYRIEDCTYDGLISDNYDVLTENSRDYINATLPRLSTVLIADIDDEGNLVVSLNDVDGNPLANYDVFISINGDEATPYGLDDNGKISIDLTEYKGELNITVAFEEDDDYKGSSDSINAFLVIKTVIQNVTVEVPVYVPVNQTATTIVASDLAATAKIAKTLSLALKDANGKALADKIIQVVVNGKISTIATDKNGIAKININYANAGTYYYTLSFLGDNDYKASLKAVKVTVNKQATKATFAKKTFKVKAKTKKVTFTLKDAKGNAIKGKKITFKVNKKTYTAKTNAKGIATVKVKLTKKGKYTAVAKFAGDSTYKAISKKAKITVK